MALSNPNASTIELGNRQAVIQGQDANLARSSTTVRDSAQIDGPTDAAQLQPADRGPAAWRLLWAAYVFEALLWGFPLSFGVFQDYYSQLPEFAGDPYIPVVGTVASAISYIGAPLVIPFIRRHLRHRKRMILIGWPLSILGLVAGSFARTLPSLLVTQGLMYGVGFLIFYYPILSMVEEFWIARRGMAYGLLCSASGASGAIMPLVIQALLHRYGYPTTLRAIAVALALATGPLIPLLNGRLPVTGEDEHVARMAWSFLKKPLFWIYSVSNVVQGLGYFFPSLFLPSYATSIGLSGRQGALLLTVMSISQVLGQCTFGYLSDRKIPLNILITTSMLVSSIATFAIWGIARSFAPLLVFAMLFGFFAAGYTAMWGRMVTAITKEPSATLVAFSFFCFGKGVGNLLAGPISARLLLPAIRVRRYGVFKYEALVLFTGGMMLLSAISIGTWYIRPKRLSGT